VLWAAQIIGTAASADLRAAQILLGPTRVIAFFLQTVLPIRFARALHSDGVSALHDNVRRVYRVLAPLVGIYCLILLAFPGPLLRLMYGSSYAISMAVPVLMLCAVFSFISYMQMVIVAALTAARQTRYIFIGSAVGCVVALVASPVLIKKLNAPGGVVTMIIATSVVTLLYVRTYLKQFKEKAIAASTKESQEH